MAERKRATAAKAETATAPTTATVAGEGAPLRYVANFEGDEINGRRYSVGDEIASDGDAGTLAYLKGIGRITETTSADSKQPAVGSEPGALSPQGPDPAHPPADPLAGVTLSEDETAARDKLVADEEGNLDKLREIATNEGVEGVTPEQDAATVATLIIVKRRAA